MATFSKLEAVRGLVLAVVLTACQNNPVVPGQFEPKPQVKPPVYTRSFGLDVQTENIFQEGQLGVVKIGVVVPDGQTPLVDLKGLPEGATYDQARGELSWKPDFTMGNDPKDPTMAFQIYPIAITIRTKEDAVTQTTKSVNLIVRDVPRVPVLIAPTRPSGKEGEVLSAKFVVEDGDYPQGPFLFAIESGSFPVTLKTRPNDPTSVVLEATTGPSDVLLPATGGSSEVSRTVKIQVTNPRGLSVVHEQDWRIRDVRLSPLVSAPASVKGGTEIAFVVSAYDPNREVAPRVTLLGSLPPFGDLELSDASLTDSDGELGDLPANDVSTSVAVREPFSTGKVVRWKNIPVDRLGTSHQLTFRSCVYSGWQNLANCIDSKVTVNFEGSPTTPPQVNRSHWVEGSARYVLVGTQDTVTLPIQPGSGNIDRIQIRPDSLANEVSYANGRLVISPKSVGLKSFQLTATNTRGGVTVEGFVFEALPSSWSKWLVWGSDPSDPTVRGLLAQWKSLLLSSPDLQSVDARHLAKRDGFVLTDTALQDEALARLSFASRSAVNRFVLGGPRIASGGSDWIRSTVSAGIAYEKRLNENPSTANQPLSEFRLEGKDTYRTSTEMYLAGVTSPEAANPQIVRDPGYSCVQIFQLVHKTSGATVPVGVRCKSSGTTWTVTGFDWADVRAVDGTSTQLQRWLEEASKELP